MFPKQYPVRSLQPIPVSEMASRMNLVEELYIQFLGHPTVQLLVGYGMHKLDSGKAREQGQKGRMQLKKVEGGTQLKNLIHSKQAVKKKKVDL